MTRLDEIRARCEVATPGKWLLGRDADIRVDGGTIAGLLNTRQDAEFIAHARADIPYMLDRLEATEDAYDLKTKVQDALLRDYVALKAENARLRAELEAAKRVLRLPNGEI